VSAVPQVKRIVDEGLLIALSAVRMAVKNGIIVGALGDHFDYDPARYAVLARDELDRLIRQNDEDARRVGRLRRALTTARWSSSLTEDQRGDVSQLALRRRVHKKLAAALGAVAGDGEHVARLVEGARRAASDEINDAVTARLIRLSIDARDPDYEQRRAARTEMLVHLDLALLKLTHAAGAGPAGSDY
jgi:hypothetical protein